MRKKYICFQRTGWKRYVPLMLLTFHALLNILLWFFKKVFHKPNTITIEVLWVLLGRISIPARQEASEGVDWYVLSSFRTQVFASLQSKKQKITANAGWRSSMVTQVSQSGALVELPARVFWPPPDSQGTLTSTRPRGKDSFPKRMRGMLNAQLYGQLSIITPASVRATVCSVLFHRHHGVKGEGK